LKRWRSVGLSIGGTAFPLASRMDFASEAESCLQGSPACGLRFNGGSGAHSKKQNRCISISCASAAHNSVSCGRCWQRSVHAAPAVRPPLVKAHSRSPAVAIEPCSSSRRGSASQQSQLHLLNERPRSKKCAAVCVKPLARCTSCPMSKVLMKDSLTNHREAILHFNRYII